LPSGIFVLHTYLQFEMTTDMTWRKQRLSKPINYFSHAILLLSLIICPLFAVAQFDSLGLGGKWHDGMMLLNDESQLKGLIRYNDKMGVVSFKQKPEDEEESFTTKRILAMDYFDSDQIKYRKFASFHVMIEDAGKEESQLLEIIMEFKEFAVLAKQESVIPAIRQRNNNYYTYGTTSYAKVGYEQFEKIYFVKPDGKAEVVLMVNEFEKDKSSPFSAKTKPYFKEKLLTKYLGAKWDQVNTYRRENKLNLTKKADLLTAMNYFGELERGDQ
jgi:hypothetical protein